MPNHAQSLEVAYEKMIKSYSSTSNLYQHNVHAIQQFEVKHTLLGI